MWFRTSRSSMSGVSPESLADRGPLLGKLLIECSVTVGNCLWQDDFDHNELIADLFRLRIQHTFTT